MTLKQSQGYDENVDPSKVMIKESLKDFAITVSEKKATLKVVLFF